MPVIFMERSLLDSLTEADIKEIIDENEGHTKYAKLEGYYEGDHDILRHRKKDSTAPNNRLVNNMAKYITDTATGYFIGKPGRAAGHLRLQRRAGREHGAGQGSQHQRGLLRDAVPG